MRRFWVLGLILLVLLASYIGWSRLEAVKSQRRMRQAFDDVQNAEAFEHGDAATFGSADLKARESIEQLQAHDQSASECLGEYLHDVEMQRMIFLNGMSEDIRPRSADAFSQEAIECLAKKGKS